MGMLTTTGGSSILAQELGAGLREHQIETHYCHLNHHSLRPETDHLLDEEPGNQTSALLDVPRSLSGAIDAATGLIAVHDRWPFHLFHLHSLQVYGQPALMLQQLRNVPFVVTCHGSDVLSEILMDRNREIVAAMLRAAAAVTCVSHHVAENLARKIPGLPHVSVIPNFVRAAWRQPQRPHAPQSGRFLHVSSLRPVKRPELLLACFRLIRQSLPSAQLAIVTTGHGQARLLSLVDKPAENGIQIYNGEEDPQHLEREYSRAAAMILTSRFEGFGLVVLEALTHRCPVVAPPTGALPEVLGLDWPLLTRDDQAASLAQAALSAASGNGVSAAAIDAVLQRYHGPHQIAAYAHLYRKILNRTNHSNKANP